MPARPSTGSLGNRFKPKDRFSLFGCRKLRFLEINTRSIIHTIRNRRDRCPVCSVRFSVSSNKPKHHRQTRLGNGEEKHADRDAARSAASVSTCNWPSPASCGPASFPRYSASLPAASLARSQPRRPAAPRARAAVLPSRAAPRMVVPPCASAAWSAGNPGCSAPTGRKRNVAFLGGFQDGKG